MKSGIYMFLNIVNNKVYVGSTKNFRERRSSHLSDLRKDKHYNTYLQNSFNKYGEDNIKFIVLEECEVLELIQKEQYWINLKNSNNSDFGYNLCIPTDNSGHEFTEDTKHKLRRISLEYLHGKMTDEEYNKWTEDRENYKNRERILNNRKKVLGFNKVTGEKEIEFDSIVDCYKFLKVSSSVVEKVFVKENYSCKNLILVKEEDYDPTKIYKKVYKSKSSYYKPVIDKYCGKSIETFDLITNERVKLYSSVKEYAEELGINTKYIYRVLSKKRNSIRENGVRYVEI